ncbi:MAG: A/G-specific adenine glycosylase [Candidatus Parcubacteria bacterium]|jgi:A/G-specific adenine glycosylase|nr:A/G-specific adenine glycosylase [Candidatus Parcubacteria bacterium]
MTLPQFRRIVWKHAVAHGRRALPWRRRSATPYAILVSEIMLQQTQVDRVVPYYRAFLKRFPTVRSLANAPLGDVLKVWQGLGYNRRAKMLHEAAEAIVRTQGGRVPHDARSLEKLPGIGPYTARAVIAFAYNEDAVFIETNLRTAVIHHFFPGQEKVEDTELLAILAKALPKGRAREWYAALMDYGAHLKRSGVRVNSRSATYTKQKAFKGSNREARGVILRALVNGPQTSRKLYTLLGGERREQMKLALATLVRDGMLQAAGTAYRLPSAGRVSSARSTGRPKVSRRR